MASARFSSKRLACFFVKLQMPVSIEIASSVQAYFTSQCPFVCVTILSAIHAIQKRMPCMFSCISHFMHICQSCMFCTHNCVGLCMSMHGTVGGDWLRLLFCAVKTMAHFEQASLLATAWANDDEAIHHGFFLDQSVRGFLAGIFDDLYRSLNPDRVYPPAFGRRLLDLWVATEERPTFTLRTNIF